MSHILIVEDDPDIREDLAELLRARGHEVTTASNGREALDGLRQGALPRVILLDLMMPVMNGWEFRSQMMQDPQLASIPVLVLSGVADVRLHAKTLQVDGFVAKPIDLDRLYAEMDRYARP